MSDHDHTHPGIPLNDSAKVKTTLRVLLLIIAGAFTLGSTLYMLRADIADSARRIDVHDRRLDTIESKIGADHDILLEIRADVKALYREQRRDDPKN